MPTPLVLVPGLLCDGRLWSHQVAYLSDVADPVVTEVPTSGSVGGMARDVLRRAPETFALAGLSMGGYVALEIMRQAPERVTALALLDTSARADTWEQTQSRLELLRLAEAGRFAEVPRLLLPRILHPARLADEDLISTVVGMASAVGPEAFERQERAIMARPDSRGDLASIGCPTLVLCGREDELTPPHLHEEMAEHIPGAQLHVVDECGHLSTLERPAQVNEALRDWLEHGGRQGGFTG
jgi:pimeloyl-ACP methyl ester carboxylesterase